MATSSPSTEPLQLNLGSLRSAMTLTLHTHHASRIWHGRAASEHKPGIAGLNGYVAVMNKMRRGAEQDDPYSDFWMLRVEDKIDATREQIQMLREQVDHALTGLPPALSIGDNLNVQPVKLPLFISSQLGFMAVYLLADYDELARKLILAHHTALIDRSTLERWLNDGAHALRSLFALAQQYRYSGCTRDDFAAKNAAARLAIEKYGELPQDVLEGTRRSRFAPPIARRSALMPSRPASPAATSGDETDDMAQAGMLADDTGIDPALAIPADAARDIPVVTRRSRAPLASARRLRQSSASAQPGEQQATVADTASDNADGEPEAADGPDNAKATATTTATARKPTRMTRHERQSSSVCRSGTDCLPVAGTRCLPKRPFKAF